MHCSMNLWRCINGIKEWRDYNTKDLQNEKIAYVKLVMLQIMFYCYLKKYTEVTEISDTNLDSLQLKLNKFTKVIIGILWFSLENFDFSKSELQN
jgi:hypothetical protein